MKAREQSFVSSLVYLVEHQFTGNGCFRTKLSGRPALKSSNILFDNLIKKHGRQLGVKQRTKFKGNLEMHKRQKLQDVGRMLICTAFFTSPSRHHLRTVT